MRCSCSTPRPEVHSFKSEIDCGGQITHRLQVIEARGDSLGLTAEDGSAVFLDGFDAVVLLAIPQARIRSVAYWFLPRLGRDSVVFDIASAKSAAMAAMSEACPELTIFGTHPLFSFAIGTIAGQTLIICPSHTVPDAHEWLSLAFEAAGGTVKTMTAEEHDLAMTYVQTAAHQALVVFADVVGSSGLDLEVDLWASRTPQFETLLVMASRVPNHRASRDDRVHTTLNFGAPRCGRDGRSVGTASQDHTIRVVGRH